MSRTVKRSIQGGIILIVLGLFFLYENIYGNVSLWSVLKKYFPLIIIWIGLNKAYRSLRPVKISPERKVMPPSFSSALIWLGFGIMFQMWTLGILHGLIRTFGLWWPLFLILMGVGKVVDAILPGRTTKVKAGEVLLVILLIILGLMAHKASSFNLSFLPPINVGWTHVNVRDVLENSFRYRFPEENIKIDSNIKKLVLEHTNGDIWVDRGKKGEIAIGLNAKIYASSEKKASELKKKIVVKSDISNQVIRIKIPLEGALKDSAEVDFHLKVPYGFALDIKNSNGDLSVKNQKGDVLLVSRNGKVGLEKVTGNIKVENHYDEITLKNCSGVMDIKGRSSGLNFRNVGGELNVSARNGAIRLNNSRVRLKVGARYAPITIISNNGDTDINAKNSRIRIERLRGKLSFKGKNCKCYANEIDGEVIFEDINSIMTFKNVASRITGSSHSGKVDIRDCGSDVKLSLDKTLCFLARVKGVTWIRNSFKDILLKNVESDVDVSNSKGGITLVDLPQHGKVKLRTKGEDIVVKIYTMPVNKKIFLSSEGGFIKTRLTGVKFTKRVNDRKKVWLNYEPGTTAPDIDCRTVYGNIVLKKIE